jgi:hypothetical protein
MLHAYHNHTAWMSSIHERLRGKGKNLLRRALHLALLAITSRRSWWAKNIAHTALGSSNEILVREPHSRKHWVDQEGDKFRWCEVAQEKLLWLWSWIVWLSNSVSGTDFLSSLCDSNFLTLSYRLISEFEPAAGIQLFIRAELHFGGELLLERRIADHELTTYEAAWI